MSEDLRGKSINNFRSKSFYMDGSLISEHLVLFFDVEGVWYSITIVDGVIKLKREDVEPNSTEEFDKDFSYPISNVEILKKYIGLKVDSVYVYTIPEIEDGILGVFISYKSIGFSYYNIDDFSYIMDSFVDIPSKNSVLVEYKLSLP
jgi:hypothetical protein